MTCMKFARSRRLVVQHLLSWVPLRGELTGNDLKAMGLKGPEIGKALQNIRLARMDGLISTRDGEAGFVASVVAEGRGREDAE